MSPSMRRGLGVMLIRRLEWMIEGGAGGGGTKGEEDWGKYRRSR